MHFQDQFRSLISIVPRKKAVVHVACGTSLPYYVVFHVHGYTPEHAFPLVPTFSSHSKGSITSETLKFEGRID